MHGAIKGAYLKLKKFLDTSYFDPNSRNLLILHSDFSILIHNKKESFVYNF